VAAVAAEVEQNLRLRGQHRRDSSRRIRLIEQYTDSAFPAFLCLSRSIPGSC
jgi:hypothetical protein